MHPHRADAKCAVVAPGAVSVVPHEAVSGTSWSRDLVGERAQPVPEPLRQRRGRVEHEPQPREEAPRPARGRPRGAARGARSRRGRCSRRSGEMSRSAATVRSNSAGTGLPSSMCSVPPKASTWPRLWLPPNVWLHGSQSTSTGGSAPMNGHTWPSACWLEHSIRCVLITPFGVPVDPEVNRIFATVSGPERGEGALDVGLGLGRLEVLERERPGLHRAGDDRHRHAVGDGRQRRPERGAVVGEDHARACTGRRSRARARGRGSGASRPC